MSLIQAILMGILQGLTEFIPVSSSGHLVLAQHFLGIGDNENIAFELFMHLGTLLAVLVFFRKTLWELIKSVFSWGNTVNREQHRKNRTLIYYLIISTVVTGVIYLLFGNYEEAIFAMPMVVAIFLIVTGIIVLVSDYFIDKGIPASNIGFLRSVIIGIGQGIAIMPGISRSGTTIACSLATGMKRKDAAQYSFLLSIPAILAGALSEYEKFTKLETQQLLNYFAGFVCSFLAGYLVIAFLIRLIEVSRLKYFAVYCFVIGSLSIVLIALGY
ncbi:MAG TPA: undecaprenyl-diphosphate phosphatase [Candidatus Cloacimonas sp.]|jgi:undecaprenyl-diphosphatase|nr:undecaprenyl-diphosphate phosphatase [Candidatus Cloacimonas sp.]HPS60949.1 undecaprenyl-diphosphate phosphatase [Candidatus Cloacimonas sp.]